MQTLIDPLDPTRAAALHTSLSLPGPAPTAGDPLPIFGHYLYFWQPLPPSELGRDGHPKLGGLIPDLGLPRRMWAGGRLKFTHPVQLGQAAEKRSTVLKAVKKEGRTGPLAFVTLLHEIWQNDRLCLSEEQDLVYREDPSPDETPSVPPTAPTDEDSAEAVSFDSTLLFRYSALTFNGHRIHYDRDYSQRVEGYRGLVVHGPLLAQLLMLKAESDLGPLTGFTFRATAPLMDFETAELCRKGNHLWVRTEDGRLCMQAEAVT